MKTSQKYSFMSINIYFFFLLKFAQRYFAKEKIVNISSAELQLNRMWIAKHLLMYQGKMYHYRNFFDENFNNHFVPSPHKKQIWKKLLHKMYFKHDFFVFNKLLKHIWLFVKNHKKNLNIFTLLFINDSFLLMLHTHSFIITWTMNLIQSLLSRYTGILRT